MKKKVVINASPDLKQAARRNKKEPIVFIRDNLVVPSKLSLIAKDTLFKLKAPKIASFSLSARASPLNFNNTLLYLGIYTPF